MLADRVNEALQALLTERNLPGRVDYLRESKQDGGDLTAIVYRVEEVSIRIRSVEFPGASPDQAAFLSQAPRVSDVRSRIRSLKTARRSPSLTCCHVYFQRGYLKAAFGPSDARVVQRTRL